MSAPAAAVLLVDDDEILRELLADQFRRSGYRVRTAGSGAAALEEFAADPPNLVVLDVMMPGMDGWSVCQQIRARSDVPVILLTGRAMELDKLTGFRLGADDYVTKPFSCSELLARAAAVLGRYRPSHEDHIVTGDLAISPRRREVHISGRPIPLTPTEYRLLEALARRLGEPVPTEQLLTEVWGSRYAGETDLVKHFVWTLRRKVEVDPSAPRHLLTERGFGYRLL